MKVKIACPKCNSDNIMTERRPNGDSTCLDCKHKDNSGKFQSINEEGVVAGDHGYDPVNIASGNSSGNAVNAGAGKSNKVTKRKVKRRKIKEAIVKFLKE